MRTLTVTSVARTEGGADSEMYTGLVTDAKPTPSPTTMRPASSQHCHNLSTIWRGRHCYGPVFAARWCIDMRQWVTCMYQAGTSKQTSAYTAPRQAFSIRRRASYERPHALRCRHQDCAHRKQGISDQQHGLPSKMVPQCTPQRRAERSAKYCCADDDTLDPVEAAAAVLTCQVIAARSCQISSCAFREACLAALSSNQLHKGLPVSAREEAVRLLSHADLMRTWKCCSGSSLASRP